MRYFLDRIIKYYRYYFLGILYYVKLELVRYRSTLHERCTNDFNALEIFVRAFRFVAQHFKVAIAHISADSSAN